MKLLDGKKIASEIKNDIANEVRRMIVNNQKLPHLSAVLVGENPASQSYVASKKNDCTEVGFISSIYKQSETISEKELLCTIDFLNNDTEIDGFIVQLPLPKHINVNKVIEHILPQKDIDGFHPMNVGRMILGMPCYVSATPNGIIELIKRYKIETIGKNCVVLGRSNIVGSPISILMAKNTYPGNCTVTLCHSKTKNLKEICSAADILIVAIGQPQFVTKDMVKEGAVVIDVGIHRLPSPETESGFKMKGDVCFDEVSEKCSYITPVPGGIGPLTRASLLQNTLKAAKKEIYQ